MLRMAWWSGVNTDGSSAVCSGIGVFMQCMRKPLTVFVMCENIRAYPLARQYQNTTNTTILIMTQFRTTMTAAALALAAIASVPTVQAAPIAYEGFDYNVGV